MRRLTRILRPHWRLWVPVLAAVLIEISYYSGLTFSFRYLVDVGLLGGNHRFMVWLPPSRPTSTR